MAAALTVACTANATASPEVQETAPIVVSDDGVTQSPVSDDATGAIRLDRLFIERFGAQDGGLEQLLKLVPGLQFSERALSPDALSDLRPESFSIAGGRFYENQIALDGISLTSRLDPAARANTLEDIPGHEQSLFIDSRLVESISVLDSNIPAEFGRFTGGVVDLVTRSADVLDRSAGISYGTSRSAWVSYRILEAPLDPDSLTLPPPPPQRPEFKRERIAADLALPLGGLGGMILAGTWSTSSNPVLSLRESRQREQENLNLFAKWTAPLGERGIADISVSYAPFTNDSLLVDVRDSEFRLTGGGWAVSSSLELPLGGWDHRVRFGVDGSVNERDAPQNFFTWANSPSREWGRIADVGTSREGGFGDIRREQRRLSLNWIADTSLRTAEAHQLGVSLRGGAEYVLSEVRFQRPETSLVYRTSVLNSAVQCRGITLDCVQREQYFAVRDVYQADDTSVSLGEAATFAELTLDRRRAAVVLGMRLDYDDFLGNVNLAPRIRGSYDLFGDRSTVLRAGFNRYYGGPLLTYRLREARRPFFREFRGTTQNVVNEWERDTGQGPIRYLFTQLNTPYSEERVVGFDQNVLGGRLTAQYLWRNNRQEFGRTETDTQPDGFRYRILNNDGRSSYRAITLGWFGTFDRTLVALNWSYSRSKTNNADYDDPIDTPPVNEFVFYRGEQLPFRELEILRSDFGRPALGQLSLTRVLSDSLSLTLSARYRGSFNSIVRSGRVVEVAPVEVGTGELIQVFLEEFVDTPTRANVLGDATLRWAPSSGWLAGLQLDFQVNNVLDARTYTVPQGQSGIETGRQFWLGVSYRFFE